MGRGSAGAPARRIEGMAYETVEDLYRSHTHGCPERDYQCWDEDCLCWCHLPETKTLHHTH